MLEDAATEAGIPLAEAIEWLAAKESAAVQDENATRLLAAGMISTAVETLTKLAQGEPRIASETRALGPGMSEGSSWRADDLAAAKILLEAGIKLRKAAAKKAAKDEGGDQRDLFDEPPSNWRFKDKS